MENASIQSNTSRMVFAKQVGKCKHTRNFDALHFLWKLTPLKIVFIYCLVGGLYILLSDKILAALVKEHSLHTNLGIVKGFLYVAGTAIMLYFLILRSISEIQKSKEQLMVSEERYEFVINNTSDGLWDWDLNQGRITLPMGMIEKLGYELNDIKEEDSFVDFIHPEDRAQFHQTLDKYWKKDVPNFKVELRVLMKNSGCKWFLSRGQAIWDNEGKPVRMIGTIHDVTERKLQEDEIKKLMFENEKLLMETIEHDRIKTEFFSNISHEFRTPLNVLLGTVQLMELYRKKGDLTIDSERLNKYIGIMRQNCYRLLRLVNNIIDVNKIDSGYLNLQLGRYDIVNLVKQITYSVREYIEDKNISLSFCTNRDKVIISCDADKMERVVLNLLSNAVKYTKPGGSITVSMNCCDDGIFISIKDTGIGVPEDKLDFIFERFRQVNSSLTRESEGSGIGLSLVKSLVEMHGGTIKVQSCPGVGSEFIVKLPLNNPVEMDEAACTVDAGQEQVVRVKIEFSDIYS